MKLKKTNMYKLLQGDCLELMKNIPDRSIDLILTDPPYLFNKGHCNTEKGYGEKSLYNKKGSVYDVNGFLVKQMGEFGKDKIYLLLNESKRVCKVMRGYYFCNDSALPYYLMWAIENKCKYNVIVLEKQPFIMNRNRYATNCEFLVRIVSKSGAGIKVLDYNEEYNHISWLYSVQQFNKISKKLHVAEKPLDILNGVIQLNTNENDLVLDPFMGSGTVGVVCKQTNRNYIGIEIDSKYYDISKERIENYKVDK